MSGLNVIKISASLYETDSITVSNVNFINYLNSVPATTFAFLSGTTSNIQDQINTKVASDSAALTGTTVFTGTLNTISPATFAFLSGATSNIQSQINAKAAIVSPQFSGTPTAPTAAVTTNTEQIATTAFVKSQLVYPTFTGTTTISGSLSVSGTINNIPGWTFIFLSGLTDNIQNQINTKATIVSPQFSGTPTAPNAVVTTNTSQIATTAFVRSQLVSPAFSGIPTAPTAISTNPGTDQIATTAYVKSQLESPAFSGIPTAPTAGVDTSTTQLATTQYVIAQGYAKIANPIFTGIPYADTASVNTNTNQLATTAFVKSQLTTNNTWTQISTFANTTASTSSTTGALVVAGGAGIAGKLTVGSGAQIIGNLQIGIDNPGGSGTGDNAYIAYTGDVADVSVLQIVTGNDTNDHIALLPSGYVGIKTTAPAYDLDVNGNCRVVGNFVCDGIAYGVTASAETDTEQLATTKFVKSQLAINNEWAGVLTIANTTASTSSTTGALVVAGGAGIAGKLTVGSGAQIIGNLQIGIDNPGGSGTGDNAYIAYTGDVADVSVLQIVTGNDTNDHIALLPSGYVGIKTTAPAYDLDVNGNCRVVGNFVCDGIAYGVTASAGTSTDQFATTAFVMSQNTASVDSPTFTGIASADTADVGTNTTQLATTAFVDRTYSLNNTWTGIATFSNTTISTTALTGAVVVAGGVGIAGNLNVGGNASLAGNLTVGAYNVAPDVFAALPTNTSGCILWLDATDPNNDGIPPANGAGITSWKDKSGIGNNATANLAITYNTTGFNGYPTLTMPTTRWLTGAVVNTNPTLTIFVVCQTNTSSQTYAVLLGLGGTAGMSFVSQGGTGFQGQRNGFVANNPTVANDPYLFETWYNGTTNYNTVHQGESTVITERGSTGNFDISNFIIGSNPDTANGSGHFSGFISEIIVYNTALTTAQRQYIEGYLSWKWGLNNKLKSDHPYCNSLYNSVKIITGGTVPTNIAIMPSANVGINTTTPKYTLDVVGNCQVSGNLMCLGNLTSVTAEVNTGTTQVATTAFVINQAYAKLASPAFTGAVSFSGISTFSSATASTTIGTGAVVLTGTNAGLGVAGNIWFGGSINGISAANIATLSGITTNIQGQLNQKASSFSPTFSGMVTISGQAIFTSTVTGVTMSTNSNSKDFATTEFVKNQGYATLASPQFTGIPRSTTADVGDNSFQIATTQYVKSQLVSPVFTGVPTSTTAIKSNEAAITQQIATNLYVYNEFDSPDFRGVPTSTTAGLLDISERIATTRFVKDQGYAPIASPIFTGEPITTVVGYNDNSERIATTRFVKDQGYATLASPQFTGIPKSTTSDVNSTTEQIATNLYVYNSFDSPDFRGVPTSTTALSGDSSRQIATTAFVKSLYGVDTTFTGIITITNTTPSSSTTTGALLVSGGVGIAGKLTVGGGAQLIGNIQIGITDPGGSNLSDTAYINYSGNTNMSILKIGVNNDINDHIALIPSGFVGIKTIVPEYDLDVNGNCRITGILTASTAEIGTNTTQVATTAFVKNQNYTTISSLSGYANLEAISQSFSGIQTITNVTASTTTTTGAVVVAGGVGIAGNLNIGGNSQFSGNLTVGAYLAPTFAQLPTDFGGCVLWLDGKDPDNNGITHTGGVTLWKDKSGSNNNATASSSLTYNSSTGVTITSGQTLSGSISITGTNMLNIFVVFSETGTGPGAAVLLALGAPNVYAAGSTDYTTIMRQNGSYMGYRTTKTSGGSPMDANSFYLLESWYGGIFDTDSVNMRNTLHTGETNGTSSASGASTETFSISSYRIASDTLLSITNQYFVGTISEIIVYNTSLSAANRTYMQGYLSWKWGLTAKLISTNQYSTALTTHKINTGGTAPTHIAIMPTANVGINTTFPQHTLDINGNCRVSGNLNCMGNLTSVTAAVDANTTQVATTAYVIAQKYAKLSGAAFTGPISVNGYAVFAGTTASINVGTGAVILNGANAGLGVAGNIWFGGSINGIPAANIANLSGITSNVQTQLNTKAPLANPTFTGIASADTADVVTSTTQLATTAFVKNQGYATVSSLTGYASLSATQTFTGVQSITNATTSTNAISGALIVTGGVGISGALNVASTTNIAGIVAITSGTLSGSTATGALVVTGGIGATGSIYVGGNLVLSGGLSAPSILQIGETVTTITQTTAALSHSYASNTQLNYITGTSSAPLTTAITSLTITNLPTTAKRSYTFVYVIYTTTATAYITATMGTLGTDTPTIKSSIADLVPTAYIIQSITFINTSATDGTPAWIGFTSAYAV